jgi:hypothetical protein
MEAEGPGVRAGMARRRRILWTMAALCAAGGVAGGIMGIFYERGENPLATALPPIWAAIAAAILLVALVFGSLRFFRVVDEVERRDNMLASTIGLYFYMIAYMVWFPLWRGALVPEPDHMLLFAGTFLVMIVAYIWKKLRP